MVGHYGSTAAVTGGLALLLLVAHIAVPYALEDYPSEVNDAGTDDNVISLKDMDDAMAPMPNQYGLSELGWVMTGLVMMLIAGAMLTILGFMPMPVNGGRILGWMFGAIGAVGAWFAFTASLFPLGVGFTTLLGTFGMYPNAASRLWIISPVIVAAGSFYLVILFSKIMANVVSTNNDLRGASERILKAPFMAAFFLAAVLVMPWVVLTESGEDRQASGECPPSVECDGTITMFTAGGNTQDGNVNGILQVADATEQAGDAAMFQGLAMGIKVMIAAAWAAFFVGVLASLGPVVGSITGGTGVVKTFGSFQLLNVIFVPWAAVHVLLAAFLQSYRVTDSAILETFAGTFEWWAMFIPILTVAPLLVMLGMRLLTNITDIFGDPRTFVEESEANAISFD